MKRVAVNLRDDAINVFPDGSSRSKPRRGGIGYRIVTFDASGKEVCEDVSLPGYKAATNQAMELLACVEGIRGALKHPRLSEFSRIQVFTDSRYVVDNLDNAKFTWPKNRWCRSSGAPVLNDDLWKNLVKVIRDASPCKIQIHWAKGKSNPHNKAADRLAKISSDTAVKPALSPVQVRRKKSKSSSTVPGSVPMEGQEMDIRILDARTFRRLQLTRHRYEVLSGPYVGNIDFIFAQSTLDIRAGHHYRVKVNNETKNPRIAELFEELERAPSPASPEDIT
jgi:ribonuclease HI